MTRHSEHLTPFQRLLCCSQVTTLERPKLPGCRRGAVTWLFGVLCGAALIWMLT